MDIYDKLAQQCSASADDIQQYKELMRGAIWSMEERIALAAFLASHQVDEGAVESFVGAYGRLHYSQITEQEQQPGQGVSEVNREILQLITEEHEELESLVNHTTVLVETS